MTGCTASAAPLVVVDDGACVTASCDAGPASAVPVKMTGLPLRPADVACIVYCCAVVPSVHDVSAPTPTASVTTETVVPVVDPFDTMLPAVTTLNVTETPGTRLPVTSVTT